MGNTGSPLKKKSIVYIIDDDPSVLGGLSCFIESLSYTSVCYSSAIDFLDDIESKPVGCIVADIQMPYMSGVELQNKLLNVEKCFPTIFISGQSDIPIAVDRIKRGAINFLTKPVNNLRLLESLNEAFRLLGEQANNDLANKNTELEVLQLLTKRELEVFHCLLEGRSSKEVARHLKIAVNTVDVHRSRIFKKMEVSSISQLLLKATSAGYSKIFE